MTTVLYTNHDLNKNSISFSDLFPYKIPYQTVMLGGVQPSF